VNILNELEILRQSYDALTLSLPDDDSKRLKTLSMAIWPHRTSTHCVDQFAPLTVLYPLLQTERIPAISESDGRRACLSHLCFLVSAFGEDRLQDGQLTYSEATLRSVRLIKGEGVKILREIKQANDSIDVTGDTGFIDSMLKPNLDGIDEDSLAALAPLKAHFGFIATSCLLQFFNCSRNEQELSWDAFAKLTIALQYADDTADWREDLPLADDNLLLVRLRDLGLDAYTLPDSEYRQVNVGHALLRHNSIEDAKKKALSYVDEAIQIQHLLDSPTLIAELLRLKNHIEHTTPKIQARIEQEILAACLISASVSSGVK
jgi:hypothetical protein